MNKRVLAFLPVVLLFLSSGKSPVVLESEASFSAPWNEEKTDSLGVVETVHSLGQTHSSIHYDLVKVLAIKSGLTADTSETLARYCALVDQINAQPDYPYELSLNNKSIPDTFPDWRESLAGTERGGLSGNTQNEVTAQYWHFPFRDPADTLTGQMVWGTYPAVSGFKHFTGPPHFWRVPITYNLKHIMEWALYNGGEPGLPDALTPVEVMYADAGSSGYQLVQPNSIQAFGIFLHSLADSYSHEECMVKDTIRAHPSTDTCCGLTYHSEHEFAYDVNMRAKQHADACAQAIWRAIREFKRVHHITSPALYTIDNNGFQDEDGIPDELEDDGDGDNTESFLELWKNPATTDLNGDGVINHSDHTTWRIKMCNSELTIQLNVKVLLEGAHPTAAAMFKVINGTNPILPYIPLSQPYRNVAPFFHTGTEKAGSIPAGVVDWVLVELRQAVDAASATSSTILAKRAAFLKTDGAIVDLDGISQVNFGSCAVTGGKKLYTVIRHRNHLPVMSAAGATRSSGVYSYDFTTGTSQAFGGASGCKMSGDKAVMVAGDIDNDGNIFVSDYNSWAAGIGATAGYFVSDLDMDGSVFVSDYNSWAVNFGATVGSNLKSSRHKPKYYNCVPK